MLSAWMMVVVVLVLYLLSSIRILKEYERGVAFRLGRVPPHAKEPGLVLTFAPIDRLAPMSLRVEALEVPAQDVVIHA
jgi:regulator of protease activity HflC (stomatin/prohibitin superfamily)